MFGFLIAARNIILGVLLSWIGMTFSPADSDQDTSQDQQESASLMGLR